MKEESYIAVFIGMGNLIRGAFLCGRKDLLELIVKLTGSKDGIIWDTASEEGLEKAIDWHLSRFKRKRHKNI